MAPTSPVTIPVYVSDNTEALLTSGSYINVDNLTLTFDTSSNLWSNSQTITVTGQGPDDDFETSYSVILMPASSSDTNFNGANPQDLSFTNSEGGGANILYNAGTTDGNMGGFSGAQSTCNTHSNKPTGTTGYPFASFSSTQEIRDLQTTSGLNTSLNIVSKSGDLIAYNFTDLIDGSINAKLEDTGVLPNSTSWWSFSNPQGGLYTSNSSNYCNGGTDNNSSLSGIRGVSGEITTRVLQRAYDSCDTSYYLLCIAKP
jgi:hypothetical protein